tara:strand:+ start:465 stop:833 length:369 start_codon:yes stop_codon:yes gene_type:complete
MTKQRGYYTLEIGGKKRTLHFSMNFWAKFTDMLNIGLAEIGDVFSKGISIKALIALIYSGLLAYDKENKNEVDYDEFDVGNWLEDIQADEIEKVVIAMTESKILGNSLNGGLERKSTDSKKK